MESFCTYCGSCHDVAARTCPGCGAPSRMSREGTIPDAMFRAKEQYLTVRIVAAGTNDEARRWAEELAELRLSA